MKHHRKNHEKICQTHVAKKRVKCTECDKDFQTKENMEGHKWKTHEGGGFKCQICEKSFTKKRHCENHEKIHEKNNEENELPNETGKIQNFFALF